MSAVIAFRYGILYSYRRFLHFQFQNRFNFITYINFLRILPLVKFGKMKLKRSLYKKYYKKFNFICTRQAPRPIVNNIDWLVNLSPKIISSQESELLNKGLDFSLGPTVLDILDFSSMNRKCNHQNGLLDEA